MSVAIEIRGAPGPEILALRRAVFVDEQGVPEALEFDGTDGGRTHWLLREDGVAVATLRTRIAGRAVEIGRVATARAARGRGHGARLMGEAMAQARRLGACRAVLSAQVAAISWYGRLGFEAEGPVHDDAGIPHRAMHAVLR